MIGRVILAASVALSLAGAAGAGDAPTAAAPAQAAPAASEPAPAVAALELEAGKPLEIVCTSKSVVVATDAANATNGGFRVRLHLTGSAADRAGIWTPVSADAAHAGSFAAMQVKTCAAGCPLIYETGGDVQLWAPAPKGVDKLAPDEILLLAVIKTGSWQLKASTFRGQQIEALESGSCQRAEPDATTAPKP